MENQRHRIAEVIAPILLPPTKSDVCKDMMA